jgi:tol-pal system protein YbgF
MRFMGKKALAVSVMLAVALPTTVWADEAALQKRIERLERIIQGQGLVSLLARVDQLQNDVQKLTGDNEALEHKLGEMQRRQRDLYIDLDERLQSQATTVQTPVVEEQSQTEIEPEPEVVEPSEPTATEPTSTEEAESENSQETPATETLDESTTSETATMGDASSAEAAPVAVENGEAAYQSALQTLRSGQYEQAAAALVEFPNQYPQSRYLPNAYYWQGEANYVLRNFEQAIAAFQTVMDRFPGSRKVADAMLKQGFSQYELGQVDVAKSTLTTVMQQYPNTSASRLAKVRLDRIKQQSN